MELKQNPFSFYDFLGYFTPGAILLYGALATIAHFSGRDVATEITGTLSFDKAEIYIPFILCAYVAGHIIAFVSSITIERYSLWSTGYPSKYLIGFDHPSYFSVVERRKLRIALRSAVFILLIPITALDYLIGNLAGFRALYAQKLDPLLVEILRKKILSLINKQGEIEKPGQIEKAQRTDFFRFVYHYAVENCPAHLPKMQNYVALYGFLRALTLLAVILFWLILLHAFLGYMPWCDAVLPLAFNALASYLLYMGFVKFYRRFSLEALMAFAVKYS